MAQGRHLIREAEPEDLPQVVAIYNHYVATSTATFDEQPTTVDRLAAKLDRVRELGFPFILAEGGDGQVLGYASVSPWKEKAAYRYAVESSIYIAPEATGTGLGAALMAELLERCRGVGIKQVIAVISDHGADASVRLHQRFGFVEVGHLRRVGYKFDRWIGTILMQKSLDSE